MRDSFIFYKSWAESIKLLPRTQQLETYTAVMNYALDDIETELTGTSKVIYELIKPLIDANNKRYKDGCKGGRPKNDEDESPKKNIEGIEYFIITEKQYEAACERLGKDVTDRAISLIDSWFARKKDTKAKDYVGRNNYGFLRADNSFVIQAQEAIKNDRTKVAPNWSI